VRVFTRECESVRGYSLGKRRGTPPPPGLQTPGRRNGKADRPFKTRWNSRKGSARDSERERVERNARLSLTEFAKGLNYAPEKLWRARAPSAFNGLILKRRRRLIWAQRVFVCLFKGKNEPPDCWSVADFSQQHAGISAAQTRRNPQREEPKRLLF
jgi:hypothetical protein